MKRNLVSGLAVLLLTIFLSGCCGGGTTKETVVVPPTPAPAPGSGVSSSATSGQQLQDLKAAHDQGAITDEEFEKEKAKILNK